MAEKIIELDSISKKYYAFSSPTQHFIKTILPFQKEHDEALLALENISFEINRGEFFGVIGLNGAGKSTLLKIISGTAAATSGTIKIKGKVYSMLELGVGFNQDLTGRENLFHAGKMYGFETNEITQKMNEIEAFAEINEAIDKPVKYYSSGMYVRLAFALFKAFAPDILIIDEALSVGDIYFQQKCFELLRQWKKENRTIIFASHDMSAIQNFCDRVLFLSSGKVQYLGDSQKAVNLFYQKTVCENSSEKHTEKELNEEENFTPEGLHSLLPAPNQQGPKEIEIQSIAIKPLRDEALSFYTDEFLEISISIKANKPSDNYSLNLGLHDQQNFLLFGTSTYQQKITVPALAAGNSYQAEIRLQLSVQPGIYTLTISIAEHPQINKMNLAINQDSRASLGPIKINHKNDQSNYDFFGVKIPISFQVKDKE